MSRSRQVILLFVQSKQMKISDPESLFYCKNWGKESDRFANNWNPKLLTVVNGVYAIDKSCQFRWLKSFCKFKTEYEVNFSLTTKLPKDVARFWDVVNNFEFYKAKY